MKRKSIIILTSFLVLVFIGPQLLYSPSLGVPIDQNTSKDFLLADGPWLDGWDFRKKCTLYTNVDAGPDYQVFLNVTYDSDMQNDFDDLRFTDDDMETELDYWIETYTVSTIAFVWVEVADAWEVGVNTDVDIYLYYGNNSVSTTSNGTNTFLFYEDWASETVDAGKWDTITSDGSISFDDTGAQHGSIIEVSGDSGTDVYELRTTGTVSAPISIVARIKLEESEDSDERTLWGMGSTALAPMALVRSVDDSDHTFLVFDDDVNVDDTPISTDYFGQYNRFMITRDGTDGKLYNSTSNDLVATGDMDPDSVARNMIVLYVRDDGADLHCDWTFGRMFVATEPIVDSWGVEESEFPPTWIEVGRATLLFIVAMDAIVQWGMDAVFIFAGLIMIPASVLLLVRGGREDLNSDKFFYFLIMFIMGWALFVGGIMP